MECTGDGELGRDGTTGFPLLAGTPLLVFSLGLNVEVNDASAASEISEAVDELPLKAECLRLTAFLGDVDPPSVFYE